jgi:hypothetical protein
METSDEESERTKEIQQTPHINKRRQLIIGKKKASSIQINISKPSYAIESVDNADDRFTTSQSNPEIASGTNIEDNIGNKVLQAKEDITKRNEPFVFSEERKKEKEGITEEKETFVSLEELNAKKAAPDGSSTTF